MHEILNTDVLVEKRIFKLVDHEVVLEDNSKSHRFILELAGAVGTIAITDDNKIILVRQYRYTINDYLLEIPCGMIDPNEQPIATAKRELLEETGYEAKELDYLTSFYSSPGIVKETIHIFIAKGLVKKQQHLDEDEFISVEYIDLDEFDKMIEDGKIKDGKTILAYLAFSRKYVK